MNTIVAMDVTTTSIVRDSGSMTIPIGMVSASPKSIHLTPETMKSVPLKKIIQLPMQEISAATIAVVDAARLFRCVIQRIEPAAKSGARYRIQTRVARWEVR